MITISIIWNVGYHANIWGTGTLLQLPLHYGQINFYNEDGTCVVCDIEDTAMFGIKLDCPFNIRRKENFKRGEAFAVRLNKYGEYALYIPASQVELTKKGIITIYSSDKMYKRIYRRYTFKGYNLRFWNPNNNLNRIKAVGTDCISFRMFKRYEQTDKGKNLDAISEDIYNTCGYRIDSYDLSKLLDHFDIVKKEKC